MPCLPFFISLLDSRAWLKGMLESYYSKFTGYSENFSHCCTGKGLAMECHMGIELTH